VSSKKKKISKQIPLPQKPEVRSKETRPKSEPKKDRGLKANSSGYLRQESLFPGKWYINSLIFVLAVLATLILYSSDLHLGFLRIDDQQYVVNNKWIQEFTSENISYIFTNPYFANYSPLHLFSYMIDHSFRGVDGYVFHLSSNLWAGLVAGFVFLLSLAFTGRQLIAIVATILFIAHPSHVEAVVWVSSRKDLVAAAFALPSLLFYLKYRRGDNGSTKWYILSIVFFVLALLGKLSVATFPAIFLALDYFIERRPFLKSLADKIPYLAAGIILAVIVAGAQPATGSRPDPYVLASALVQNSWLLSGFGEYVIYRVPPQPGSGAMEIAAIFFLVAAFIVPFFLRKKIPMVAVYIYWILFAFIPTQVLSFVYPVADRYQFFPSAAAVILIAWGLISVGSKWGRSGLTASLIVCLLLSYFWLKATLNYLSEWNDPRSVWFGASAKSSDHQVFYNLGWNYMDKAAAIGKNARKKLLTPEEKEKLASAVWQHDPRLSGLINEWKTVKAPGPVELEFQKELRNLALQSFNRAAENKRNQIIPELFFHRGMLYLDFDSLARAKTEFQLSVAEAERMNFADTKNEVLVNCHFNLGVLTWKQGNYQEALQWMTMVEEEQARYGRQWFPNATEYRKQLETILASLKQN
jgi:hypothetical protein